MKASKRTKDVKKKALIYGIISFSMWIGLAAFAAIAAYTKVMGLSGGSGLDILSEKAKAAIVSVSTTTIICIIGTILIKDKIRFFLYLCSLIIMVSLYDKIGMYIVLGIWATDEYFFYMQFKRYRRLKEINKEIDRRE